MDVRIAVPEKHVSSRVLNAGLEMNTRVNEGLIASGEAPTFDQAVKAGVRWKPEPPGLERFDHAAKVGQRKWGDCDDLAPMRAATLRVTGEDPNAKAIAYKSGPGRWHAIVERGDGRLEDPSQTAGMRVSQGSRAAGIPPAVVGMMFSGRGINGSVRPFVAVRRDAGGYLARVDVPIEGEDAAISCSQRARSPAKALSGCMAGACVIGGESGMCGVDHLDKMWALQGLLKGAPAAQVAAVCGVDVTKDALLTLQEIAPALVEELRAHWKDARTLREAWEKRAGRSVAGAPFAEHEATYGHESAKDRSPYAQRFAERGRQFVGAATGSPYTERFRERGSRAFVSEQAVGAATGSPYLERFRERGSRAFVSEQAVGWGGDSPYTERFPEAKYPRARRIIEVADFGVAVDRAMGHDPRVEGFFDDAFHAVSNIVKPLEPVLKPIIDIHKTILQGAQGVISLVPGVGTGISAGIGAGLALLEGGSPLDIAIKAAYGAIPIPAPIRLATDIVVDAALSLAHTSDIGDAAIATARKVIVDKLPEPAKGIGGQVFDTLAHVVLSFIHKKPTHAVVTPSPVKGFPPKVATISKAAHYVTLAKVAATQHAPAPKKIVPIARAAPKPAPLPAVLPTLAMVVTLHQPRIVKHVVALPVGVKHR